jgi:hypothetical protein
MATSIASLLTQVRNQLVETTANFWSDDELKAIMRLGAIDLWGAILDLHQDHYFKINTDVVLRANAEEIADVPPDCFRVLLIEPRDMKQGGTGFQCMFSPRKYNHPDFVLARTQDAADPSSVFSRQIYYDITGVGSPVEPPHILTGPQVNSDIPLRMAYCPSLPWDGDVNPVPGESDNALKAWTIAYARAKETDTREPDPGWLSVYATEKQIILVRLTPREEQEPEVVEDLFQGYGSIW